MNYIRCDRCGIIKPLTIIHCQGWKSITIGQTKTLEEIYHLCETCLFDLNGFFRMIAKDKLDEP